MLDRDFPPTPTQWKVTIGAVGASAIAGLLLFGGFIPGIHPDYTPNPIYSLDGREYYWTTVDVPLPTLGSDRSPVEVEQFRNVTFHTWITNWSLLEDTEYLHENASEANGSYSVFALGGPRSDENWTDAYVTPDGAVGLLWSGGFSAYLLVLV